MANAMDEYLLDNIVSDNDIRADIFLPFTIMRLQQTMAIEKKTILSVQLLNVGKIAESHRELYLSWSTSDKIKASLPIQEHVITEWAAVGIACVLVPMYTNLRILQVTQAGDGFDYWIGDDEHEYALGRRNN